MILTLYEPFRHWSETGSVYILSDPHFGDSDCKLMDPGWIEPEEQVSRINAMVMKNDTFVCLGDVGDASFVKQIKAGKKILLLGNHDKKKDYKGLFDEIYDGPLLIAEKILLSHEPVYGLPWCLNIHGHDHSNMESYKEGCKHLNLAANVCGYTPVSLGKLIKGGILSDVTSIHRITINDRVIEKKEKLKMKIRKSRCEDISEIMNIISIAKEYMIAHGNPTQWGADYPGEEVLKSDIMNNNSYVITDNERIVGIFTFIMGDEPTYQIIKNGEWHYDKVYGTIHRLASNGISKGVARACFEYCQNLIDYIRIDTHKDNISMQKAIENFGFRMCGNIYVEDGSERIAHDKIRGQVS